METPSEREYFEEDIKTENDEEEKPILNFMSHVCSICHKVYKSNAGLSTHIKSAHERVKYSCDQCEKQFTRQGDVKTHIQSVHESVKYLVINVANN